MPFWKPDPEKKAERLRRKSTRKQAKADAAAAKADAFDPPNSEGTETATVIAGGRSSEVKIRKHGSKARNQRLKALEKKVAEQEAEIEDLQEQMEELLDKLESRSQGTLMLSDAAIGALRTFTALANVNDKVQQPMALVGSTALDALADSGNLQEDQQKMARIGGLLLQLLAYYDAEQGLGSVWGADPVDPKQGEAG